MNIQNYYEMYPPKTELENKVIDFISDEFDLIKKGLHIKSRGNDTTEIFTLRFNYWEHIGSGIISELEKKFDITINEVMIEDDDCGELFWYDIKENDREYTDEELEEMEFVMKYESGEIDELPF